MQEIIRTCYEEARKLMEEKRSLLERMAQTLLEKEKIDQDDVLSILGPRADHTA